MRISHYSLLTTHTYNLADNSLPALKRATFLAFILMVAPVCGLRPVRALRLVTEKVPKPTNVTLFPDLSALVTAPVKASSAALAWDLLRPASSAILATNSALFIVCYFEFLMGDKCILFLHLSKYFLRLQVILKQFIQLLQAMFGNQRGYCPIFPHTLF